MGDVLWTYGHPPGRPADQISHITMYGYHDIRNFSLTRRGGERDDSLLYITLNGTPHLRHGTEMVEGRRGSVSFYFTGEDQYYRADHWEGWWFHLHPSPTLRKLLAAYGITAGRTFLDALSDREMGRLAEVFTYPKLPDALAAYRCANLVERILLCCLRHPEQDALVPRRTRMSDIANYIHLNLSARHSVEALAAMARLSPSHFAHLFRDEFGVSVYAYITQARLQRAQYLLATTKLNAAQVGREVGYADPYHFYTAFKKAYGMPPGAMRRDVER